MYLFLAISIGAFSVVMVTNAIVFILLITLKQAAIKYEADELAPCKSLLEQCLPDDPEVVINSAAILFKEAGLQVQCVYIRVVA